MTVMRRGIFTAQIEYNDKNRVFQARLLDVQHPMTFEGRSVSELESAFENAVVSLEQQGFRHDGDFSGKFVIRISPELHRSVTVAADHARKSINSWVTEALEDAVKGESPFTYYIKLVSRDDPMGTRIAEYARRLIGLGMTGGRQSAAGDIVTFTPTFKHLVPLDQFETVADELGFEVVGVTGPNYF